MRKKSLKLTCLFLLILMLIPIRIKLKDGGSVRYKAILYTVHDVHSLKESSVSGNLEYNEGICVEILGFKVFDNVK